MDDLASRIRTARTARGLTQQAVADHLKINRVNITQWEKGTTRPDLDRVPDLSTLLGTTTEWLLHGRGDGPAALSAPSKLGKSDKFRPEVTPGRELVGAQGFPIYAAAQGGNGHLVVTMDAIEHVKWPSILDGVKGAYGIRIVGDSMEPAFFQGDMALVHPGLPAQRGKNCILYSHDLPDGEIEAIVKYVVGWTETEWLLRQYNPRLDFKEPRADWPTCHVIVGRYEAR